MRSPACKVLALVVVLGLGSPLRSQSESTAHSGIEKTPHFDIRFRPGTVAEASVDRIAVRAEEDLAIILKALELKDFDQRIRLFLYDDVPDLQKTTGVPAAGYSTTLESHIPHDNDQTRLHELVHVVAEQLPEKGPERRNLFFAEGLANAVLVFVHGVHVHHVAAFHLSRGELPTLTELHEIDDFYGWLAKHPGFDGYDVGGSWFRFLLDTQGARKTRRYYAGVAAKAAFGVSLESLEKAWHAKLAGIKLRPGLVALLEERSDGPSKRLQRSPEGVLNDAILGPDSDWSALVSAPLVEGDPGAWVDGKDGAKELKLDGAKSDGDWCVTRFARKELGDAIVRCRAQALEGCQGLRIQIGSDCQALLLKGQGAFIYNRIGGVGHDARSVLGEAPVDLVLRRKAGKAQLWIDGRLVAEAAIGAELAPIAVGCYAGPARFLSIRERRLD